MALPSLAYTPSVFPSNEPPETVIVELLFANMPVVALVTVTLFKDTVLFSALIPLSTKASSLLLDIFTFSSVFLFSSFPLALKRAPI